jgi:hypothetical protein
MTNPLLTLAGALFMGIGAIVIFAGMMSDVPNDNHTSPLPVVAFLGGAIVFVYGVGKAIWSL